MGKLILCSSRAAVRPYRFSISGVAVYSIEELCYYIYHNIYEITPEYFDKALVAWLRNELGMTVIAGKLETMLEIESSLKDMVISILCSCDYYDEDEIKALLAVMNEIENLPYHGKQKRKADMYLRYGRYTLAKKEYDRIIGGGYAVNLTPKEYGDILHNHSIACFLLGMYSDAIMDLKDAYSRNNDSRTLRQYLYTLLLCGKRDTFAREVLNYGIEEQVSEGIVTLYNNAKARAEHSGEYTALCDMKRYSTDGEFREYAIGKINTWKQQYREGTY